MLAKYTYSVTNTYVFQENHPMLKVNYTRLNMVGSEVYEAELIYKKLQAINADVRSPHCQVCSCALCTVGLISTRAIPVHATLVACYLYIGYYQLKTLLICYDISNTKVASLCVIKEIYSCHALILLIVSYALLGSIKDWVQLFCARCLNYSWGGHYRITNRKPVVSM